MRAIHDNQVRGQSRMPSKGKGGKGKMSGKGGRGGRELGGGRGGYPSINTTTNSTALWLEDDGTLWKHDGAYVMTSPSTNTPSEGQEELESEANLVEDDGDDWLNCVTDFDDDTTTTVLMSKPETLPEPPRMILVAMPGWEGENGKDTMVMRPNPAYIEWRILKLKYETE